mgnify:FL=1
MNSNFKRFIVFFATVGITSMVVLQLTDSRYGIVGKSDNVELLSAERELRNTDSSSISKVSLWNCSIQ